MSKLTDIVEKLYQNNSLSENEKVLWESARALLGNKYRQFLVEATAMVIMASINNQEKEGEIEYDQP